MADWIQQVALDSPDFETYVAIMNNGARDDLGDRAQQHSAEELRAAAQSAPDALRFYLFRVNDRAIGALHLLLDPEDPDVAVGYVRVVSDFLGYRTGQALIAFAEGVARVEGRRFVRGTSCARTLRDDRNTRFLKKMGYRERRYLLRQDCAAPAERHWGEPDEQLDGYTVRVVSATPDLALSDALARLSQEQQLEEYGTDARRPQYGGQVLQHRFNVQSEAGLYIQYAVLFDARGDAVGFSTLTFNPRSPLAEQYETYIRPVHRSDAALEFLKRHGMRHFVENNPDCAAVRTLNPMTHPQVLAINRSLGFEDVCYYRDWEKELT